MKEKSTGSIGFFTIGIAALFLAGFLLLVIFGAKTYQRTVEKQAENSAVRAELSYFSTIMRSGDLEGAVELRSSEYGPVFVLTDGSGFALRVYARDGLLLEDYEPADAELDPAKARVIGRTELFELERTGELIRIHTDEGEVLLHPRCG